MNQESLVVTVLLIAVISISNVFAQKNNFQSITILHTNDFHGRIMPFLVAPGNSTAQTGDEGGRSQEFNNKGLVGGFAYQAVKINEIRSAVDGKVLLVHAGDTFSDDLLANLTSGEPVITLMNRLNYDFLSLGNHDFDYGFDQTRKLQNLANFPMRAANILLRETDKPIFGDPYKIFDIGDIKVGLLALGYYNTPQTGNKDNIKPIRFISGIEAARQWVPEIRNRVDILAVVSHMGTAVDEKLAKEVKGIDLIIGGHSHNWIDPPEKIGDTWIVEALSNGALLGELNLQIENKQVTNVEGQIHTLWNDDLEPDSEISHLIDSLRAPYQNQLETKIGHATNRIGRKYKSESPFDKLTGYILMEETNADLAMLPGVGYGITLAKGPISREQLFILIPHPAKMATVQLTGEQIIDILEQSAQNQKPEDPEEIVGGLIQTAGMNWSVSYDKPIGQRISDVYVNETPIDPQKSYKVVTQSGMIRGIHNYTTISEGTNIEVSEQQLNEIVERYFTEHQKVFPPEMGDIIIKNSAE